MAATTLDVYDDFLKEWYLPEWIDQLTSMTTTWKLMRRKLTNFAGKYMVIPIRTGRNFGVGSIPPSGSGGMAVLYPQGRQSIDRALVDGKIMAGSLQVAQDVLDKSKNDQGAFFEAIDFEMRGLVDDIADYADNVMHIGGDAALAQIDVAVVAGVSLTVDNHNPFFEGMHIQAWNGVTTGADTQTFGATSADTTFGVGNSLFNNHQVITAVQRNVDGTGVLTLSNAQSATPNTGAAIGNFLSRAGVRQSSGTGKVFELMGLRGAIDAQNPLPDTTFQSIDRTTNPFWRAVEIENGGVVINEDLIQQALDHTHDNSRGDVDTFITHRIMRRIIYSAISGGTAAATRFADTNVVNIGRLSGKTEDMHPDGSDYLFFDGRIPIVVDRFSHISADTAAATNSRALLYGLDLSSLYIGLITDFTWWAPDGHILHRSDGRAFGVMADLYLYGNLVCDAPSKNFKMNCRMNLT